MDHRDNNPPWWTRSMEDHLGPLSDIFLLNRENTNSKPAKPEKTPTDQKELVPNTTRMVFKRPKQNASSSFVTVGSVDDGNSKFTTLSQGKETQR